MKDEPIRTSRNKVIIDGVDVSKCKHFKNRTCIADSLLTDMDFSEAKCELCKNCYFKQLTRKTQECEGIKKQLDRFKTENKKLKDKAYILFDEAIIERDNFIEELKAEKEQAEQKREALQMSDNEAREIVAELKAECEELRRSILKIFACLIKANKDKIIDTLWVDNVTTLWDYVALTLGVEGDQTQIEEQIIQKINEVLNDGTKQN